MSSSHPPRWYGLPLRVLLVTFIGTLLSFAFSLLFAIVGLAIVWLRQGVRPNMAIAYRSIALPAAIVGGSITLVLSLVMEIRHHRQSKTLSAIEKVS